MRVVIGMVLTLLWVLPGEAIATHSVDFTCLPSCAVEPGTKVTFTAVTSADSASFYWDLDGDNDHGEGTEATAERTFPDAGTFSIGLDVASGPDHRTNVRKDVVVAVKPKPEPEPEPTPTPTPTPTPAPTPAPPAPPELTTAHEGFDDLLDRTPLTTQIAGLGFPDGAVAYAPLTGAPLSFPRVISPASCAPGAKLRATTGAHPLRVTFDPPAQKVSLFAGVADAGPDAVLARLIAFDAAGAPVADSGSVPTASGTIGTPISVEAGSPAIASASLEPEAGCILADEIAYDVPTDAFAPRPRIEITSPAHGAVVDDASVVVRGRVIAPRGLRRLCVRPDATDTPRTLGTCWTNYNDDGTFALPTTALSDGEHELTVWAQELSRPGPLRLGVRDRERAAAVPQL